MATLDAMAYISMARMVRRINGCDAKLIRSQHQAEHDGTEPGKRCFAREAGTEEFEDGEDVSEQGFCGKSLESMLYWGRATFCDLISFLSVVVHSKNIKRF